MLCFKTKIIYLVGVIMEEFRIQDLAFWEVCG